MKSAKRYWLILFRVLKVTQPSNSSLEPLDCIENPIIADLAALLGGGQIRTMGLIEEISHCTALLLYLSCPVHQIAFGLHSHRRPSQISYTSRCLLLLAYPSRRWSYEKSSRCLPRPWDIAPLVRQVNKRYRLKTCRPLLVGILNLFFPKMNRFKFCE